MQPMGSRQQFQPVRNNQMQNRVYQNHHNTIQRARNSNSITDNRQAKHQQPENTPHDEEQVRWEDGRAELHRSILPTEGVTQCVTTTEPRKRGERIILTPRKKGELAAEMNYMYQNADGMPSCQSMRVTIKRTLQEKIFKSVKFLPKNNTMFKYPDWVEGVEKKEATVLIVNGVLGKMNLSHYTVKQKTLFWITYGELFRQFFTEHRSATQESLKRIFFDSALGEINHCSSKKCIQYN